MMTFDRLALALALARVLAASALAVASTSHAQTAAPATAARAAVEPVTVRAVAHFDFDRTTVLPADQKALLSEVATMKDVTWKTVTAEGYADNVGGAAYNERLSLRRAKAVRTWLVGQGLAPAMVRTVGAGEARPVADNASADGRAQNRRTEVTFEGVRATTAP
ncbi:MAG: OmpA family protein [Betaproteobacteria bacterium]